MKPVRTSAVRRCGPGPTATVPPRKAARAGRRARGRPGQWVARTMQVPTGHTMRISTVVKRIDCIAWRTDGPRSERARAPCYARRAHGEPGLDGHGRSDRPARRRSLQGDRADGVWLDG